VTGGKPIEKKLVKFELEDSDFVFHALVSVMINIQVVGTFDPAFLRGRRHSKIVLSKH